MQFSQKIAPCLWFASEAEEAAQFLHRHLPEFEDRQDRALRQGRLRDAPAEGRHRAHRGSSSSTGQPFTALNGGPIFKFNEAISLQIYVEDQKELDYYWDKLTPGGDPKSQVCGWLKDKYGLSWQVVPQKMVEWFGEPEREVRARHDRADEDGEARYRHARAGLQRR